MGHWSRGGRGGGGRGVKRRLALPSGTGPRAVLACQAFTFIPPAQRVDHSLTVPRWIGVVHICPGGPHPGLGPLTRAHCMWGHWGRGGHAFPSITIWEGVLHGPAFRARIAAIGAIWIWLLPSIGPSIYVPLMALRRGAVHPLHRPLVALQGSESWTD